MEIVGITVEKTKTTTKKLAMIIWGPAGVGKTTLAATMPGKKLFIQFDPKGVDSISNRDDVLVADFSAQRQSIVSKIVNLSTSGAKTAFFKDIESFIDENEVDSIIIDSLTTFGDLALYHAIDSIPAATLAAPTWDGYRKRLKIVMEFVSSFLKLCEEKDKHVCFVAHETTIDDPTNGRKLVTLLLGGSLPTEIPIRLGEVWHYACIEDKGVHKYQVTLQSSMIKKPMKTRMFSLQNGSKFFIKNTDNIPPIIENLFNEWKKGDWQKIAVPVTAL